MAKYVCPTCGKPVEYANFCCGFYVETPQASIDGMKGAGIIIGIIVGIVSLIGAVTMFGDLLADVMLEEVLAFFGVVAVMIAIPIVVAFLVRRKIARSADKQWVRILSSPAVILLGIASFPIFYFIPFPHLYGLRAILLSVVLTISLIVTHVIARRAYKNSANAIVRARILPEKSYKILAWVSFGMWAVFALSFPLFLAGPSVINTFEIFGLLSFISFPAYIILGIIALAKRRKHKPKDRPKAKRNTWAWLSLLPFIGVVFAIVSLAKKDYSSLSKHLACWVAIGWTSIILLMLIFL